MAQGFLFTLVLVSVSRAGGQMSCDERALDDNGSRVEANHLLRGRQLILADYRKFAPFSFSPNGTMADWTGYDRHLIDELASLLGFTYNLTIVEEEGSYNDQVPSLPFQDHSTPPLSIRPLSSPPTHPKPPSPMLSRHTPLTPPSPNPNPHPPTPRHPIQPQDPNPPPMKPCM